jgi:hypothetical protein
MKFVPTPQDYLQHLEVQPWMNNGIKVLENEESQSIVKNLVKKINEN